MEKVWFTADTHFGHANIIEYCNRPFGSIMEMNDELIRRWNVVVGRNDRVYHLGDFALSTKLWTNWVLKQLNGRKYLCIGSHEHSALQNRDMFEKVTDTFTIRVNGQELFLSHYLHKVWPNSHYGCWHLFGHSHGGMNEYAENEGKLLDVGVDSWAFAPVGFEEVAGVMKTRPDNFNLLKGRGESDA